MMAGASSRVWTGGCNSPVPQPKRGPVSLTAAPDSPTSILLPQSAPGQVHSVLLSRYTESPYTTPEFTQPMAHVTTNQTSEPCPSSSKSHTLCLAANLPPPTRTEVGTLSSSQAPWRSSEHDGHPVFNLVQRKAKLTRIEGTRTRRSAPESVWSGLSVVI